jgi:hypothetical protein
VTVARCGSSTIDWQKDAWSLVVEFYQSPDAVGEHTALGWFLAYESPKAPQSLLYTGNHFELTEGERVVAKGMIVEELDP